MFSKKHPMNLISIVLIAGINAVYMFIFSLKPSVTPAFSAIAFLLLFLLIVRAVSIIEITRFGFINKNNITTFLILFTIILSFILIYFNDSLPQNRFTGSISEIFNSLFVFNNTYSKGIGYLNFTKDIVFSRILGITGFVLIWLVFIIFSNSIKENIVKSLFLIVTPVLYLSIIIVGEFVFMISLVIMLVFLPEKYIKLKDSSLYLLIKLVVFIILSFINITTVLFTIIYTLYYFRKNLFKAAGFLTAYIIGLLIILYFTWILPGRLDLSGSLISILIFCSIAALFIGWSVSDLYEVYFSSGILIFLFIAVLAISDAANNGFNYILSGEYGLNLVASLLPVSFLLVSIHDYKVDKYLGKLLTNQTLT